MLQETKNRQKAKELGAQDAAALIATVPYLARLLSKQQIIEFQKVLDAAVLNPVYKKAADEVFKESVISQSGALVLIDQAKKRKGYRILAKRVRVSDGARCFRVDHHKMLTADALVPRTSNPDEVNYLAKVRMILHSKGVWLRLGQPWSAQGNDPAVWEFSFSLGCDGDTIPTDDAMIDRDELLHTAVLGSGYFRSVLAGPVQTEIKRLHSRLSIELDSGWFFHKQLIDNRANAGLGVAQFSDWLGGKKLPNATIWDRPRELKRKAMDANLAGDVASAQILLVAAAFAVQDNARLLAVYQGNTIDGAGRVVRILKVARAAGQVAEVGLMLTGAGAGLKALRATGGKAASEKATRDAFERGIGRYVERSGHSAAEMRAISHVTQPGSTILGGIKGGHSSGAGTGFHTW